MKCQFIKSDNTQCRANHIKDSLFCFRHDPDAKMAGSIASSRGGQNRALQGAYGTEIRLKSPSDVRKFIGTVINGVWTGQVPVSVGSSMGFLTRCWLDANDSIQVDEKINDLENRLDITESLNKVYGKQDIKYEHS